MKWTAGIILFLLFSVTVATAEEYAFRKTNWGMSKADVIKSEGEKPLREEVDWVSYKDKILKMPCFVFYTFVDDKLTSAKYVFTQKHTNMNDFISEFTAMKEALTKIYGKPVRDNEFWKNSLYRDNYEKHGFAISLGHLSYFTAWETEGTEIVLGLYGNNYEIWFGIDYIGKAMRGLEEKKKEKKLQEQL